MRKSSRPVVYIAHALRGDWGANLTRARAFVDLALENGYAPVAPYLMGATLRDDVPEERAAGLDWDAAVIERCDEVWVCGEVVSEGVRAEIGLAEALNIRVVRIPDLAAGWRYLSVRSVATTW